jgi:lipoic acid synthetase
MSHELKDRKRLPHWMKMQMPGGKLYMDVKDVVEKNKLHTICTSGNCPNIGECWAEGTATFMILGDICTRACKFCAVKTGRPLPPDENEAIRLVESIRKMGIKHAVITSVDRDDLEDGGAGIWAETISLLKQELPELTMETLIPDLDGKPELIQTIIDAGPEVISHNLETVRRLTPNIRSKAKYDTSLKVIEQISKSPLVSKSGIMLGLGETEEEILTCMDDLLAVGCKVMTIGQYLQPTLNHMAVEEFIPPEKFDIYEKIALQKGFKHVESSPLVRSSYHAIKHIK